MTQIEKYLIALIKANNLEVGALYLQDYIQRNGPVSNEAGDEIKKILAEKQKAESQKKRGNNMQDSIRQIATNLRALACEIGGNHHTPKESEELLMNFADKLDDISYELITASRRFETISGVSRKGYELYLRQKNIEELKRRKESETEE